MDMRDALGSFLVPGNDRFEKHVEDLPVAPQHHLKHRPRQSLASDPQAEFLL